MISQIFHYYFQLFLLFLIQIISHYSFFNYAAASKIFEKRLIGSMIIFRYSHLTDLVEIVAETIARAFNVSHVNLAVVLDIQGL